MRAAISTDVTKAVGSRPSRNNWQYRDRAGTLRMDAKPGERLLMKDGAIVVTDSAAGTKRG